MANVAVIGAQWGDEGKGKVVDWLGRVQPQRLWADEGASLLLLGAILLGSTVAVALQTIFKHQTLAGNFPMLLRWNFHRLMLGQSMGFYQDEFAGRVATKVMQTALAVRDTVLIVADILVFVVIYFVTMVAVVGSFDAHAVELLYFLRLFLAVFRYRASLVPKACRRRPFRHGLSGTTASSPASQSCPLYLMR